MYQCTRLGYWFPTEMTMPNSGCFLVWFGLVGSIWFGLVFPPSQFETLIMLKGVFPPKGQKSGMWLGASISGR